MRIRARRAGKLHQVAHDAGDPLRLPDDGLERIAPVRLLLCAEQALRVARDDRKRVVDFVPGSGGEFGQGREFRVARSRVAICPDARQGGVQVVEPIFEAPDQRRAVAAATLPGHLEQVRQQ